MNHAQLLRRGAEQLHISLDEAQVDALLKFVNLLQKWNKAYNLSAIKTAQEIITKHILDSLSVVPYIQGTRIVDVGSGAGLPGIPLACACKDKEFLLLDAKAKKTHFIQQVIIEIELKNVQVVQQNVAQYTPLREFDTVISRAFTSGAKLLEMVDHLLLQGKVIIMLGKQTQLQGLPENYTLAGVYTAHVPMLHASRHIAVIEKNTSG